MSKENEMKRIQELASKPARELMNEKYAIGAFLFSAAASGDTYDESLDLAVVYNTVAADIHVGKEERKIDGKRLEVWRYPIAPFMGTFEDEKLRDKPDTWMWTGLWIDCMQNGIILADPTRRLADWKTKAKLWKWRESEIKPAIRQAKDNLDRARQHLAEGKNFDSLICLREGLTCVSAARLMKHGLIPSFRPKDLSQKLCLVKDREKQLSATYEVVNDAEVLDHNSVEGLFVGLKQFVDSEWGPRRIGPRSEMENARSCMNKRNLVGALLSLRYSAYWLGFHIINKSEHKLEAEICNGENHVKMTSRLIKVSEPFYEFYKRLYFAQKWDQQQLKAAMDQIAALLGN